MKSSLIVAIAAFMGACCVADDVRLLDLEPTEADQIIEKHDQNLDYAPKIDSNVPAVRFLGEEPHHVLEDIYLARQYHGQDGIGGYVYGYNVPDIAKTEKKKASGDLKGAYNYIAGNGKEIKVEYWDNGTGFHQIDNVPTILPKQIDDSPAVKEAKEKFLARWHEEAERNSHPVQYPYNSDGQYASGPLSAQQNPQYQQQSIPQFSNQYQSGSAQQPQYQGSGQNQGAGQYQAQGSLQGGQYQGQEQYTGSGQYQGSVKYQGGAKSQNQYSSNEIDYQGKASDNENVYANTDNSQQYNKKEEEEDVTGPPRGFFYEFNYPVGIIVNKGEALKSGEVKQIYDQNKAKFEAQLQGQVPPKSSGYIVA